MTEVDLFAGKGLDHPHPGNIFGQEDVKAGRVFAYPFPAVVKAWAHKNSDQTQNRQHKEGNHREAGVDRGHQRDHNDPRHHIVDHVRHLVGQKVVERVGVADKAGHRLAHRLALVKGKGEFHHMVKELAAQINQNSQTNALDQQ